MGKEPLVLEKNMYIKDGGRGEMAATYLSINNTNAYGLKIGRIYNKWRIKRKNMFTHHKK